MNHDSEHLKLFTQSAQCFVQWLTINLRLTSELKNLEKLLKQTDQALEPYKNRLEMCIFVPYVKLYS